MSGLYNLSDIPADLRSFFVRAEIGLEPTPADFVAELVAVFREARRVLKDDGTLWLNLGDSYNSAASTAWREGCARADGEVRDDGASRRNRNGTSAPDLKPKDMIGIPWRVAFALQQPYYTGQIKDERDRVWLAAMIDAEGSICGTEYVAGDRTKTNLYISITNTSVPIIDKCERLFPQEVKHVYEKSGPSSRVCYRWDVERIEEKSRFIREVYPHLVAKRKQAIVGFTFLEMQRGLASKKKGYLPEQHDQRSWCMAALSRLNAGEDVDLPDWMVEPPSLFEPGYYLRQDIIWSKPNPMPESVTDRCTKAHEYLFLLSKSPRYYFDAMAISEPVAPSTVDRLAQDVDAQAGSYRVPGETNGAMKAKPPRFGGDKYGDDNRKESRTKSGNEYALGDGTRNRRSVWTVATQPFKEAHFATFPPALIEPCILAGCPKGGTVLDPFGGAGTTGLVADRLQRSAVLIELNHDYLEIAKRRIHGDAPLLAGAGT